MSQTISDATSDAIAAIIAAEGLSDEQAGEFTDGVHELLAEVQNLRGDDAQADEAAE